MSLDQLRGSPAGEWMGMWLRTLFEWIDAPILAYLLIINTSYLLLIVLAILEFTDHLRRAPFAGLEEDAASPLTLPVSLVIPAYREEVMIEQAVRALLALRYPTFEVVIVVDGDPDPTLDALRTAFDLVEVPMVASEQVPVRQSPRALYLPREPRLPIQVVVKSNSGRADSCNVGINFAQYRWSPSSTPIPSWTPTPSSWSPSPSRTIRSASWPAAVW